MSKAKQTTVKLPALRQRIDGKCRKDLVMAAWLKAGGNTSAGELAEQFPSIKLTTLRSWVGTWSHGYNFPRVGMRENVAALRKLLGSEPSSSISKPGSTPTKRSAKPAATKHNKRTVKV